MQNKQKRRRGDGVKNNAAVGIGLAIYLALVAGIAFLLTSGPVNHP